MIRLHKRLTSSFAASLLINALVVVPALSEAASTRSTQEPGQEIHRAEFEKTLPPPDEVKLGIEESDASTLTWIGYEEFHEHMARLAEVDQAQFAIGGGADGGGTPPPTPAQATPPTEAAPADATPPAQPPTEQQPAPPLPEAPPTEQPVESPQPPPVELPSTPVPTIPAPPTEAPKPTADPLPTPNPADAPPTDPAPAEPPPPEPTPTPPQPTPTPPQPAPPQPTPPVADPIPGPPKETPGPSSPGEADLPPVPNPSDRDSDPTATVPVNVKRVGGPIAAQGLEVRTRKPRLTPLQQMQFGRTNVLAKIDFDRTGKPKAVSMGRLNTLKKRIDWLPPTTRLGRFEEVIQTTLYRWRASGKELQELAPGKTLSITFELSFK